MRTAVLVLKSPSPAPGQDVLEITVPYVAAWIHPDLLESIDTLTAQMSIYGVPPRAIPIQGGAAIIPKLP